MSGSSHAEHLFTRISVGLDSGVSIDWAPDENGSFEHGAQHHQREEQGFRAQLVRGTAQIEVLCDALEAGGRVFTVPRDPAFKDPQRIASSAKFPVCTVTVLCAPPLSPAELEALLAGVEAAIAAPPPAPAVEAPPAVEVRAPAKPWWKIW